MPRQLGIKLPRSCADDCGDHVAASHSSSVSIACSGPHFPLRNRTPNGFPACPRMHTRRTMLPRGPCNMAAVLASMHNQHHKIYDTHSTGHILGNPEKTHKCIFKPNPRMSRTSNYGESYKLHRRSENCKLSKDTMQAKILI